MVKIFHVRPCSLDFCVFFFCFYGYLSTYWNEIPSSNHYWGIRLSRILQSDCSKVFPGMHDRSYLNILKCFYSWLLTYVTKVNLISTLILKILLIYHFEVLCACPTATVQIQVKFKNFMQWIENIQKQERNSCINSWDVYPSGILKSERLK